MKNNNKFRLDVWGAITLGTIALYALFLLYPMAYLIRQSVLDPDTGSFTLAYFTKFFSKSYYFDTLINSFKVSITATVLSIAIGTPLAYLFTIFKIKGKSVLNILIVVASMSAPFIGAYSWILLLGRSGIITTFFKNLGIAIPDIYGFGGIVLVMTLQLFPLVFLYAKGALKNIDNSLIEAAENLGCSGIACFFKVVVPLIMPTLLAGTTRNRLSRNRPSRSRQRAQPNRRNRLFFPGNNCNICCSLMDTCDISCAVNSCSLCI